jgi:regulator of sigma E protease
MTAFIAVLAFIAALGPLIVFHELGHYFAARYFNVRVLRFSVGFGKPLLKIVRGRDRTEWTIAAIPFGGFVAMLDERAVEEKQYSEEELKRAFHRQSVWARIVIVLAGPVANFIAAFLVYIVVYLYGVAEPRAILAEPPPLTIAAHAGVRAGDEVLAVDGASVASLVSLRFRLIKDAVDAQDPRLTLRGAQGGQREVSLDFSGVTPDAVEGDLLASMGLLLMPPAPSIESVTPHGPADRAGLLAGDRILAVDGTKVSEVKQFVEAIKAAPDRPVIIKAERGNAEVDLRVTPELSHGPAGPAPYGVIGVVLPQVKMVQVHYGLLDSITHAAHQTADMTALSARMLGKMVQGQISLKNLSGPITIADYAGQSARLGLGIFLTLIAFISINLGLMNLMPIPMLDGGHLLYYCVEIIQRRPPSERFLEMSQRAGMAVLACLMCVALFNDFSRLLS